MWPIEQTLLSTAMGAPDGDTYLEDKLNTQFPGPVDGPGWDPQAAANAVLWTDALQAAISTGRPTLAASAWRNGSSTSLRTASSPPGSRDPLLWDLFVLIQHRATPPSVTTGATTVYTHAARHRTFKADMSDCVCPTSTVGQATWGIPAFAQASSKLPSPWTAWCWGLC